MTNSTFTKAVAALCTESQAARVKKVAKVLGVPVSTLTRVAILEHLPGWEELAKARLEAMAKAKAATDTAVKIVIHDHEEARAIIDEMIARHEKEED